MTANRKLLYLLEFLLTCPTVKDTWQSEEKRLYSHVQNYNTEKETLPYCLGLRF